ncbi:MAG TPA: sulfatase [Planctomycetota bacterium]|nr:sulfatase [Planctomycetota bacterium]
MRILLAVVLLVPFASAEQDKPSRPNFVIMMCDDQRWDAMSLAGNTVLKTPNMDRIGREGIVFRNAFVTNSLCGPSRATILTGTYSHTNGMIDNRPKTEIRPDAPWMPDLLRASGYEVAFCGKSHQKNALRERTWDYYFGYKGQGRYKDPIIAEGTDGKDTVYPGWMDDVVTDKAVAWLKGRKEKPFCLFLFFKACHRSWDRPARLADLYKDVSVPKNALWDDKGDGKSKAFLDADNRIGGFKDVADYQAFMKDYYATLVGADENIGRVLETLTSMGKLDDTLLLHTGDNGFFLGEWQRFDKRFMHEVSIRVPMVVRYPKRIKPGSVSDRMVLNLDIAPTLLDLAGVPIPKELQGRSWVPLFKDPQAEFRKDWLYEYYEYPDSHKVRPHRGVRTEQWKLMHFYQDPEEFELYDLEKDPWEKENLYGKAEHADRVKQLKQRLDELRKETGDR